MESFRSSPGFSENPRPRIESLSTTDLVSLPRLERDALITETSREMLSALRKSGAVEYKNVGDMYKAIGSSELIVRRENPERVLAAVEHGDNIQFFFPEGDRYSNAVQWTPSLGVRGLENAYLEGYGHRNGIVTVIGFKPGPTLDVQSLPDASRTFPGIDRMHVRSVLGSVSLQDMWFVSMRSPVFAFPEEEMSDQEQDMLEAYRSAKKPQPAFIHRGFLFLDHISKQ